MKKSRKASQQKGRGGVLAAALVSLLMFGFAWTFFYSHVAGDAAGQPEVVPADPAAVSPVLEEAAAASALGTGSRSFDVGGAAPVPPTAAAEAAASGEKPVQPVVAHNKRAAVLVPPVPRGGVPSHWTPVNVGRGKDPLVTLCKLDYDSYWRKPHALPMFKDLVAASGCRGPNSKSEYLSKLKAEMDHDPDGTLEPTGFVFHETRCGSTLVADMLASHPHHLTFSESSPPASLAGEGDVGNLRTVMRLMCRSSYHTKCFFKFQSINTPRIAIFRKAFPDVPWAFVFREPVQVMMSHLKGGTGSSGAVCLRSKSSPTKGHLAILGVASARKVGNEDFCAAHLAYLSTVAFDEYQKNSELGLMLPYTDLPHLMPQKLLAQHFHSPVDADGLARMETTATFYSKGRRGTPKAGEFESDSEKKEAAASTAVQSAAKNYLYPIYNKCMAAAKQHDVVHPVLTV